ncbi:MAG TPA: hypothetical protein PL110_14285 [Candidatus Eremiobacteraeota bacterium]|nr:MAG: hypothetical protein BWY64_00543 [bacterium ADurb.Bin363]HPZ09273.1 hypothetical protein [Candidatus Eremiobacteraeota bacterium]
MFSRICVILFFILLFPLNSYGFNESMEIRKIEKEIETTRLNYEHKILTLNTDRINLENSKDEKQDITSTEEKTFNEELEKKIKELEAKLEETTKNYEAQLNTLKASLEELKKEQQSITEKMDIQQTLQQITPISEEIEHPSSRQAYQSLNPDISVVGDILFSNVDPHGHNSTPPDLTGTKKHNLSALHTEKHHHNPNDLQLRELELAFQGVVDPYARGDFFLGIHAGELHLEEGYMTLLNLPGSLQSRLGKFRMGFGRANRMHRPEYYLVDYPNMIKNFLGPEGFASVGAEVSVLLPTDTYVELAGEVVTGGGESPSFAEDDNYIYLGHIKTFFDLNENHSLELGGSYARGKCDVENNLNTNLAGFDVTYRWLPTDDPYSSFILQGEAIFSRRDLLNSTNTLNSNGYYLLAQYQMARRWYLGLRYDYSEFPYNNQDYERAYSAAISFCPSEVSRFRLQYTHTDRTFGEKSDSIFLQTTFTLGPHKH